MRAILLCGGRETRWGNYLGCPKQLIPINGVPILRRTVKQLQDRGVHDITIVGKDARFTASGAATLFLTDEQLWPTGSDADKFLSSRHLWDREGRTLVVYGDCYFTERAMDTIVMDTDRSWKLFCRFGPNDREGNPQGGECFVQSFFPEHIEEHELALWRIASLNLEQCGGWEHYRAINGVPDDKLRTHVRLERHHEIDDLTDDFDFPSDYEAWIKKFHRTPKHLR